MTRQLNSLKNLKSIAGGVLVGLGIHLLSGNLVGDASQLRRVLGLPSADILGLLPSVALAASQAAQAYDLDQHRFLYSLLHLLPSFWPLLLVIAGMILLRDTLADKVKETPSSDRYFENKYFRDNKYFQNKDAGCRFRCPSFDA